MSLSNPVWCCAFSTVVLLAGTGVGASASELVSYGHEPVVECTIDPRPEGLESRFESRSYQTLGGTDSDGDGIADIDEAQGVAGQSLLDFPRYGADPGVPDLFVQANWSACDPIVEYCGPNNSLNQHRMTGPAARRLAEYFAPDIRLHVDNGVAPDVDDGVHGAWGGAHRVNPGDPGCSPDTLGPRFGSFHELVTYPIGSGGQGTLFGFCSSGNSVSMGVVAQELGHNFGIGHGGNPESFPANCKPHYRSPMNYAYTYERDLTQFSRGQASDIVLNPTRMDEELGLSTTDPAVLDDLRGGVYRYYVRDDGAIDWNRNGRIDPGTVRAAATWGWASCEQSVMSTDKLLGPSAEPMLGWLPDAVEPRLYLVTRGRDDHLLTTRYTTRFDLCDLAQPSQRCTNFQPPPDAAAEPIPGTPESVGAPALAGYLDQSDTAHLMVVSVDLDGQLFYQDLSVDGAGVESWSQPQNLPAPAGGALASGATAIVDMGAYLLLLAGLDSGEIHRWDYDIASRTWSARGLETWQDGAPLATSCPGFATALGYQPDLSGPQLYLVLPVGERCILEFARLDTATGSWTAIGPEAWVGEPPMSGGRPALAYVPFDPSVPEDGRFYVAWRVFPAGAGLISMSEGNDHDPAAEYGRFRFDYGAYMGNVWAVVMDGVTLMYDPRFDDNLRVSWVYKDLRANFYAYADGIVDKDMYDQNDYTFILQYMACSLRGAC